MKGNKLKVKNAIHLVPFIFYSLGIFFTNTTAIDEVQLAQYVQQW